MYEDIREKAIAELEEKKKKRRDIQTIGLVFAMVSIVLYVISTQFYGNASFWIRFPILILVLLFGVIWTSEYGFPFLGDTNELSDEEIEREMVNIYRKSNLNKLQENDVIEELELKEIEELKDRYEGGEDYV